MDHGESLFTLCNRKALELETISRRVSKCTLCPKLVENRTNTVFGKGKVSRPEIMFVGEAPGATEDEQGEPFVGAAGRILNRMIAACGLTRDDVYITNIIKCRPPGNRVPTEEEIENCSDYLVDEALIVCPKSVMALGNTAASKVLNPDKSISELRGVIQSHRHADGSQYYLACTYHPAYLLRNPSKQNEVLKDLDSLLGKLGRRLIPGSVICPPPIQQ
jgi:DNA polymerase